MLGVENTSNGFKNDFHQQIIKQKLSLYYIIVIKYLIDMRNYLHIIYFTILIVLENT